MGVKFGPSGNSDAFYEAGFKRSVEAPAWIASLGLDAYEYQCSKGVKITPPTSKKLGEEAQAHGVSLSIHAPYYINLSSEGESREKAIDYILQTLRAARIMGAARIVVHSGSCAKISRESALAMSRETLVRALAAADAENLGDIHICPETMGKINQLGTVGEVMELCRADERLIPCLDFGHIYARSIGEIRDYETFKPVFDTLFSALGEKRARVFHSHFSRIEYTEKGGEKKHWRYEDTQFGFDFEPIARLIAEYKAEPTVICESLGTMAHDAAVLKQIYARVSSLTR